jgi:hypothetical protein
MIVRLDAPGPQKAHKVLSHDGGTGNLVSVWNTIVSY